MEKVYMENGYLCIDLHDCQKDEAKIVLDAQINHVAKGTQLIKVIHGFHGGTKIQSLVRREYKNKKIIRRSTGVNDGITIYHLS